MSRPRGGIIGAKTAWTSTATSAVWTLRQAEEMKADGKWPRGPEAPTSLTATTGDTELSLNWTAPATTHGTITNYLVEYTPSGGSAAEVLVGSAATSYQLTGLTNDTEYSVRVAAISAGGQGDYSAAVTGTPSAAFDPASLSLMLWLDSADSSTVTLSGSVVTEWRDKSGNSTHFTPMSAGTPSYSATGWDGSKPAVIFNGGFMRHTPSNWTTASMSAYIVAKETGGGGYIAIMGDDTGSYLPVAQLGRGDTGLSSIVKVPGIQAFYVNGIPEGGSLSRDQLRNLFVAASGCILSAVDFGPFHDSPTLGGSHPSGQSKFYLQGPLAEVIFVDNASGDAERQKVEGYLAHKWSMTSVLPVDHPYKSSPP